MLKKVCYLRVAVICLIGLLGGEAISAETVQADGDDASGALTANRPVLEVEAIELRPNLLPNASFEEVDEGGLKGWHWNAGNTDATMVVDDAMAHSGKRSVRIANSTRFAPHVFGQLNLPGGVAVRPNTSYTFSCYVKGKKLGIAWFGGGHHWHVRAHFPRKSEDQWVRVVLPFTTEADDTNIPVMVITESPAEPFWVDDVQLVEGSEPMPVFDGLGADLSALRLESPTAAPVRPGAKDIRTDWNIAEFPRTEYVFCNRELWTRGWLSLPRDLAEARLSVRLATPEGKVLATAETRGRLAAGVYWVVSGFFVTNTPGGEVRIECSLEEKPVGEVEPLRLSADMRRRLVTAAETEAVLQRVETLRDRLRTHMQSLKNAGRDAAYPQVTLTILENFVGYAREDIERGELARAYDAALQMEAMGRQAIEREFLPEVPRYVTQAERPSFRIEGPAQLGTARWTDGRVEANWPLQFVGVGHFRQVRRDIEKLNDYGLNIIQIEFGPRSVVTGPDTISTGAIEECLSILDRAAGAGVAVNLLISPHYFPDWAFEKWPHLRDAGGGFLKVDVHAPEARQVYEKFLRTVIPRLGHHPALHSICLSNEPVFTSGEKSRFVRDRWHRWLEQRHGTIAELNRRWGSEYADFVSIPVPAAEFDPSPLVYDYVCFNQEAFAEFHGWMASIIRELAPDIPLHAKIMVCANFVRHAHGPWSISPELFAALSDYNGNDAWKYYRKEGPWASSWQDENMGYDFQRSMADKPIFNSENHLIPDRTFDRVPPSHISNVFWQGAVHGQSATTTWVWERTYSFTHDFSGSIMHRPQCVEAMGRTGLDLMRLSKEVTTLQEAPIQVALLWSPASLVAGQDYLNSLRQAYEALNFCGVRVGFVTERQLAACAQTGILPGRLGTVRLVVAPEVRWTPESTIAALAKYQKRGGRLLLVGKCFRSDEYGAKRKIAEEFPEPLEPPADSEEAFAAFAKEVGKLPFERPVQLQCTDGTVAWGVEYLAVRDGERLLVNLCNYRNETQSLSLLVNGKAVGGTDLRTGRRIGKTFELPPLEPSLVAIEVE